MSFKRLWRLLKETFKEWQEDDASRLAAALAYYTVFSLAPLLILVIAIAGMVFDASAAREQIVNQIQGLVGADGASVIETAIENANRPGSNSGLIATLISLGILLFGASGVFVQLQASLNQVWNVKAKPTEGLMNLIRKRFLSFAMILVIGFLLLVSLVLSAALSALSAFLNSWIGNLSWLWQLINIALSIGVITLLFAMIFKYLPDVKVTWRDVTTGALITAILFTLGKFLIGLYLGNSSFGSTYGAAGSIVILLAWIYYSAQILFFGAEFTQVYARRYGSQIVPDEHAVRS
ncbi:YihY/virulence factor BrkB family protein [Sphaerothrix gracilis]|uniref:YihY/virulence factor BrkB family protein n=1 Tax=Sphaerothrix gracilis TaxID=3151835 RepID=UPI0031FD429E